MDFIKSQNEAKEMLLAAQEESWKAYKEEFIDTLPGMSEEMINVLKVGFTQGFQHGVTFMGEYFVSMMFQQKLISLLGKSRKKNSDSNTKLSSQPTAEEVTREINELLKKFGESGNGNPSKN